MLINFSDILDWLDDEGKYYLNETKCKEFFGFHLSEIKNFLSVVSRIEVGVQNKIWLDRLVADKNTGRAFYTGYVDDVKPGKKPIIAFNIHVDLNSTEKLADYIDVYSVN